MTNVVSYFRKWQLHVSVAWVGNVPLHVDDLTGVDLDTGRFRACTAQQHNVTSCVKRITQIKYIVLVSYGLLNFQILWF